MKYKNTILLKDYNDEQVNAIIFTNESTKTIQEAIFKAKNEFYKLEETNNIPMYINCEYEYIRFCLQDKYNIELIDFWNGQEVYY